MAKKKNLEIKVETDTEVTKEHPENIAFKDGAPDVTFID